MCESSGAGADRNPVKTIPVKEAIGTVLAHDITEITPGKFKGRAFKKGHIIRQEDMCHLQRLGKEHLYVLDVGADEMHEDEAARVLAHALMGEGVSIQGEPKEGKINIMAARDGLLKINKEALQGFNMLGDVMCATLHGNTVVKKGQIVAGTRAIPLVVKKKVIEEAMGILRGSGEYPPEFPDVRACNLLSTGVVEVREMRRPAVGVVITGNEVYDGKIQDAFAPVIRKKVAEYGGEIKGVYFAPDDELYIEERLRGLLDSGCDLLITTGGMSVDPDDVTRFAIRNLGAVDLIYGSAVLPGAMVLVAYLEKEPKGRQAEGPRDGKGRSPEPLNPGAPEPFIPVLGIPACGMYHKTTIFDLILPRILAGERIGRRELAELGHGGLCLNCQTCRYPICPFGKS
jgi:molybdenum cofactor synthesis domain-containing protein